MLETFYIFIQSIFGVYQPCLVAGDGGSVQALTDWGYVASVVIFCIVLIFVLKTVGGVIYEWLR